MAPLKTLFILPTLNAGGAERVLITLANGTNKDKNTPIFLTVNNKGSLRDLINQDIPYHSLNKRSVLRSIPFLYNKVKEINPDIIISTMAHMNFAALALKPLFPKTKFIIREAITPSFFFQKYKKSSWAIKALYKHYYPKADLILSPTEKIFDEFKAITNIPSNNFQLLNNPVDTKKIRWNDTFPHISESREKTVHFLACGRLGKQKGFDRLIHIASHLNMPCDWKITILGEGHERPLLEKLIEHYGLEKQITLPGLIKAPYTQFASADCFLMPSRFEGLPNVILETLAAGTPAIVTKESGGIDEIAKKTNQKDIQIVDTMEDFKTAMEAIRPSPTQTFRSSLLPGEYHKEKVLKDFNTMLETINQS